MSKAETKDLSTFLKPFPSKVRETVWFLRDFVWDLYPQTNELIYDNYNAVAFGWSPTDRVSHTFCSIAVGRTSMNVHFGFYWGSEIADPKKLLLGAGIQYRYILVKDPSEFPNAYIKKLLKEAYANSLAKVIDKRQLVEGLTITKSISAKKRTTKTKPVKKVAKKKAPSKSSVLSLANISSRSQRPTHKVGHKKSRPKGRRSN